MKKHLAIATTLIVAGAFIIQGNSYASVVSQSQNINKRGSISTSIDQKQIKPISTLKQELDVRLQELKRQDLTETGKTTSLKNTINRIHKIYHRIHGLSTEQEEKAHRQTRYSHPRTRGIMERPTSDGVDTVFESESSINVLRRDISGVLNTLKQEVNNNHLEMERVQDLRSDLINKMDDLQKLMQNRRVNLDVDRDIRR